MMRGVFTIPVTPFDQQYEVDETSLESCLQFCIDAGAHGIVYPVNASEFSVLTDEERKRTTSIAADVISQRIPLVVGVSGVSPEHAAFHAQHAREIGADAVIAMPPYAVRAREPEIFEYYRVIASASRLPVFIQNWSGPIGTPMSVNLITRIVQEIEGVDYIKEETQPAGHMISAELEMCGESLKGVMGGMAGRHLIDEFRRGACGTMPACEVTDVHVALWNALETSDEETARTIFNRLLPLLNIESVYGAALYKEVLYRRGVITHPVKRIPAGFSLDTFDHRELDRILSDVSQLFTTAPIG